MSARTSKGPSRLLVAPAEGFIVTAFAAQNTGRPGFLLVHRPGFVAPTLAARKAAALDSFIKGRLSMHFIAGGSDAEQQRDGDSSTTTSATAARSSTWPSSADAHEHRAVRLRGRVLHLQHGVLGRAPVPRERHPDGRRATTLLRFADQSKIHDKRLWAAIAGATGASGNTTALVGTPEQVAESILADYDLGVRTILIRGFDPLNDARQHSREPIPLVRAEVAKREDAARVPAAV